MSSIARLAGGEGRIRYHSSLNVFISAAASSNWPTHLILDSPSTHIHGRNVSGSRMNIAPTIGLKHTSLGSNAITSWRCIASAILSPWTHSLRVSDQKPAQFLRKKKISPQKARFEKVFARDSPKLSYLKRLTSPSGGSNYETTKKKLFETCWKGQYIWDPLLHHPCVLPPYPLDYPLAVRTLQGYGSVLDKIRRLAVLGALPHSLLAARLAHQDQAAPSLIASTFVEDVAQCR